MSASERLALLWATAVGTGAVARLTARAFAFPVVVSLLVSGLLLGRQGLGLIEPLDLGQGLEAAVGLLVALVLFEGGLCLRIADAPQGRRLRQLVVVGLPVSFIGAAVMAHVWAQLDWDLAALFSAVIIATGPTVINPLVRQIGLDPQLARLLEGEGLLLEPVAAVSALVLLQYILEPITSGWALASMLLLRLGLGALSGAVSGFALSWILRQLPDEPSDPLRVQLCLGTLLALYVGCEQLLGPAAGLPAAMLAGLVVGRRCEASLAVLEQQLTQFAQLAITLLFPLLAADVTWQDLSPLGWGGFVCVLSLMLTVRPLAVALGCIGSGLSLRQQAFLAWIAPRGIVSASTAGLVALRLEEAGVLGAGRVQGLVFLTILMTVILNGCTASPLARWLQVVPASEPQGKRQEEEQGA